METMYPPLKYGLCTTINSANHLRDFSSPAYDFCANCGVTMTTEYVPTNNAEAIRKETGHWPMLMYRPTLTWSDGKGRSVTHTFDYGAGIGHVRGLKTSNLTVFDLDVLKAVYETGYNPQYPHEPAYTPELADVLYCLIMDSYVLDYSNFEDWAESLGYDTDSRSAEKTYRACIENALKLRQLIDIDAARVAFEDF